MNEIGPTLSILPKNKIKKHNFLLQKMFNKPKTCLCCKEKIKFSIKYHYCANCGAICHWNCSENLPIPCLKIPQTRDYKGLGLADLILKEKETYNPTEETLMIPAQILQIVNVIESREINKLRGIYSLVNKKRFDREIQNLYKKGKVPVLSKYESHYLAHYLMYFLKSLKEPIFPIWHLNDLTAIATRFRDNYGDFEAYFQLKDLLMSLPKPNKETLSFLILHMKLISRIKEIGMNKKALSIIFSSILLQEESSVSIKTVEILLSLPNNFWLSFLE